MQRNMMHQSWVLLCSIFACRHIRSRRAGRMSEGSKKESWKQSKRKMRERERRALIPTTNQRWNRFVSEGGLPVPILKSSLFKVYPSFLGECRNRFA
ncbi:hypothetical protein BDW67DRAFT_54955 [Aspergillus spinulosporus]